ncbi:hypothetical protein ACFV3R_15910 [Streptomyces sp. NPDC059740]|uniref:hypothetical protein n=1 Tax=Streptomyces sp. NPDC059740 TaxID=3346926 RepID=UPI0036631D5E
MSGATGPNEDMVVGRTNSSEERTILLGKNGEAAPNGYADDFVLHVGIDGDKVLRTVAAGVDGISAKGTVEFPTGGAIGTMPAGNGVYGRGLNGVVGYVHAEQRDKDVEQDVQSGVFGAGGASAGVFGHGAQGVLGYSRTTARDKDWEAERRSGVSGRSDEIGVRGKGGDGGVQGASEKSFGVEGTGSPGVRGVSGDGIAVYGESGSGPGVHAVSDKECGGLFQSRRAGQVWLIPRAVPVPDVPVVDVTPEALAYLPGKQNPLSRTGRPGELQALVDSEGHATLWFCVTNSADGGSRWAQVLLGDDFEGTHDPASDE